MANEHIGQKQQIGLGKETTSGTPVAASVWFPKISGTFLPKQQYAYDEGAYGVIDQYKNGQNVKNWTEINFGGNAGDVAFGNILLSLFGTETPCVAHPIPGAITGTFVEGETITESTSAATGVLKRADVGGTSKILYISVVTGTFVGAGKTLTGGTSAATAVNGTIESPAALRYHLFRRLNSNTPITYTIYGSDPVSDDRSPFCALDTLSFEVTSGGFAKFDAKFMGKKLVNTTAQAPTYSSPNFFLAKFATFKNASAFTGLDAATAVNVSRLKLEFKKNLTDFQAFGSTDVTGFYNQQFSVTGDIDLLYNATTFRDYSIASTAQAMRLTLANTDVTIGSASNPTLQFDIPSVKFTEFNRSSDNKGLVKATLKLTAEFDLTTALTIQCLLSNSSIAAF